VSVVLAPTVVIPTTAIIAAAVAVPSSLAIHSSITSVTAAVVLVVLPVLFLDSLALGSLLFENADIAVVVEVGILSDFGAAT
jgi:hypothetical protein